MQIFPPGYIASAPFSNGETDTSPGWSWACMILPQLEQAPVFASLNFSLPVQAPANFTGIRTNLTAFLCPSDQFQGSTFGISDGFGNTLATAAPSSYAASCGDDLSDTAFGLTLSNGTNTGIGRGVFFATVRSVLLPLRMEPARQFWLKSEPGEMPMAPGPVPLPVATSIAVLLIHVPDLPMPRKLRHVWSWHIAI